MPKIDRHAHASNQRDSCMRPDLHSRSTIQELTRAAKTPKPADTAAKATLSRANAPSTVVPIAVPRYSDELFHETAAARRCAITVVRNTWLVLKNAAPANAAPANPIRLSHHSGATVAIASDREQQCPRDTEQGFGTALRSPPIDDRTGDQGADERTEPDNSAEHSQLPGPEAEVHGEDRAGVGVRPESRGLGSGVCGEHKPEGCRAPQSR